MRDCVFCKIIRKELPAEIVYEDSSFMVFKDIHPAAKTHLLVVPKKHVASVNELEDADLAGGLVMTARKIALEQKLSSYKLLINTGSNAGQTVDHLHMHLIGGEKLPYL